MEGIGSALENIALNNAIVGAIFGFLGKVVLDRLTLANKRDTEVDIDMRKRRLDVYPELWSATALLPKWPRNDKLTYEELQGLQETMRTWYFSKGGIYLSRSTFDTAYKPLQEKLTEVSKLGSKGPVPLVTDKAKGERDIYEDVRSACSKLRTALTKDVQSRREVPFWTLNL